MKGESDFAMLDTCTMDIFGWIRLFWDFMWNTRSDDGCSRAPPHPIQLVLLLLYGVHPSPVNDFAFSISTTYHWLPCCCLFSFRSTSCSIWTYNHIKQTEFFSNIKSYSMKIFYFSAISSCFDKNPILEIRHSLREIFLTNAKIFHSIWKDVFGFKRLNDCESRESLEFDPDNSSGYIQFSKALTFVSTIIKWFDSVRTELR